jgi:hypothetical protein
MWFSSRAMTHPPRFASWCLPLAFLAACSASGGSSPNLPTDDVPAGDLTPVTDRGALTDNAPAPDTATSDVPVTPTDTPAPTDAGGDAMTGPSVAWGMPCDERSSCQGEDAYCALGFGRPVCLHACNAQAAWSSCESGRGVCVPNGNEKVCVRRCGDGDRALCEAGTSCQFVAYRDNTSADAGVASVGVCLADCSPTGADACMAAGRMCGATTRTCLRPTCPDGCAAGAQCVNGECVPSPAIPLYGTCRTTTGTATNGCREEFCLGNTMGGYCTAVCNSDDDSACGPEGVCWSGNFLATPAMGAMLPERLVSALPARFDTVGGRLRGVCLKPCADSGDCPTGFHCGTFNGRRACMPYSFTAPNTMPGAGLPGSACTENTQCVSGQCVPFGNTTRWGFCARASTAVPCPAGTAPDAMVPLACIPTCAGERSNECPAPFQCFNARPGMPGQCLPAPCRENADCRTGSACNPQTGRCEPMPFRTGDAVGSPCTAGGATCASGQCLTMSGTSVLPGGYCTLACVVYGDNSDSCPAGSLCNIVQSGQSAVCVDLCDNAGVSRFGTCRTGYICQPFNGDRRFGVCVAR